MIDHPISVYINWASYDELSDNVELDEALATRQLDELLRLRAEGVQFDYYLMDCFWFDPHGGYRTWRKPHWPQGPEAFLDRCLKNGVKPGLWIGGNSLSGLHPIPAWQDSITGYNPNALFTGTACLFYGGFLPDLLDALEMWYQRGVRLYKFDFMQFNAVPPALSKLMLPSEIRQLNEQAFMAGMKGLKAKCPELVLIGYNGFEEAPTQDGTTLPFKKTISTKWLEVFDALYCGDPRPADVPASNFWRSKDVYSDHMVKVYERNGFPLTRIDSSGFMVGTTGTCYNRRTAAWQGMLLLSLARGGWANTYYGNLDLLDTEKAHWFARAQQLFYPYQAQGRITTIGGVPGELAPYGYLAEDGQGALITAVNPAQQVLRLELPLSAPGRILFSDAGFKPCLEGSQVVLGPEQMVLIGYGNRNDASLDLGIQQDVFIPLAIEPLEVEFKQTADKTLEASFPAPADGTLRIILQQVNEQGIAVRTSGGSPPDGISLGKLLIISATQNRVPLSLKIAYDKVIWSGLSWAVAELPQGAYQAGETITVKLESREPRKLTLLGKIYRTQD